MSRNQILRVKIEGQREAVEAFSKFLNEFFPSLVSSPIINNARDSKVHCFVNLNPFQKEATK